MKITYFVHGATRDNESKKASGHFDVNISDLGIQQINELTKAIKWKHFDVVFCSDLTRAVQTAQTSFDRFQIIPDKRLRECHYWDFTLKSNKEIEFVEKEVINKPFTHGESFQDVEMRMRSFLEEIYEEYQDKHIAIVAHKAPQLALEVIAKWKTREQAMDEDRRKRKARQPGREFELDLQTIQNTPNRCPLLKTITNETFNMPIKDKVYYLEKNASRVVIFDEEWKVAILHVTKKNFYKIPGGWIEIGEKIETGLFREIQEEVGINIEIQKPIGKIIEYKNDQWHKQISYCYLAKVKWPKWTPNFTEKEKNEGFELLRLDIDEAIQHFQNVNPTKYYIHFFKERDLQFLLTAKKLLKNK